MVSVKLEEGLLARVDAARGGRSRTALIEEGLELVLSGAGGSARRSAPAGRQRPGHAAHPNVVSSFEAKSGVRPIPKGAS